jgi:hypothetical protein
MTFGLNEKWSLVLYPDQGITYNIRSGRWFVPVEAMLTNRVAKSWEYSVGGAYALVEDDRSYRWLLQGRLTFYY